jgi:beta-glucosidase
VMNTGEIAGDEVIQLYLADTAASAPVPIRALVGFDRISLRPREKRNVAFTISPRQMSLIDDGGKRVIEPGEFLIHVGGGQPGFKGTPSGLSGRFTVSGRALELAER